MESSTIDDNQYITQVLSTILPNLNVPWPDAMDVIERVRLDDFPDGPRNEQDFKALLKLQFALQQVTNAQSNPTVLPADFQGIAENYFLKLRYEIANVNPVLLFDYLNFIARPYDDKFKTASFDLLQRYGDYVISKCVEKQVDPKVIEVHEEKLKTNIIDSLVFEIKTILTDESVSLEKRQENVKNFLKTWMNHTSNIDLLARFGNRFIKEREFKNCFGKRGFEMFSFQDNYSIGVEIVNLLKKRLIDIAIQQNSESDFQQLASAKTAASELLHYPNRQNMLTNQEKMIIIYMAERGFTLPNTAPQQTKAYFNEAVEQSPYKKALL